MMLAHNLHFTYAKEGMKWVEYVLVWPRYVRSVTVLQGKQHCSSPSGVASFKLPFPRALPQCKPRISQRTLCALWLKAKFAGKDSGLLLFTQSKHLWHIIYACTMLTHLPPSLPASERGSEAFTPWAKYFQINPQILRRYSLLIPSNPQQHKITHHSLTMQRHKKTF